MSPGVTKSVEILLEAAEIAALVATPCLSVLAYRAWSKHGRQGLPLWRRTLGIISVVATFLSCLLFVSFFLLVALGFARYLDSGVWFDLMSLALATGIPLALTLRGPARAQTLFAGLLMILLLWSTVNF